jgi:hypothetical protein
MSDPDYRHWLTKQQAADALHVSTKTIEALAKSGQLQQARWRRPETGQTLAVYHPGDVADRVQERQPGPPASFLVPGRPAASPTNGNGHGSAVALARPAAVDPEALHTIAIAWLTAWSEAQKVAKAEKAEKPVLTLDEAVAASGWSRTYLLRQIRAGTLRAQKDGGWKIRRRDLETL